MRMVDLVKRWRDRKERRGLMPDPRPEVPFDLIAPLWRGIPEVTMRTGDWQRVLLHYGADYLHLFAGMGHRLKGRRAGPGIYSVRFVEPKR